MRARDGGARSCRLVTIGNSADQIDADWSQSAMRRDPPGPHADRPGQPEERVPDLSRRSGCAPRRARGRRSGPGPGAGSRRRWTRRCRSCGRWCAARPAGAGTATAGSCPRCRPAPRRSRRRPSARRVPRRPRRRSSTRSGCSRYGCGPVAVEQLGGDGVARGGRGSAGTRRRGSARAAAWSSSAWAAGSWPNTLTMSAFLLPSRNSTSRYCADWKPELVARKGRISAYSLGVSVASTAHWSVSVCWMCLTRASRFSAGDSSSARSRSRAERSSWTISLSHSSEVWCWMMKSSSSCWGGSLSGCWAASSRSSRR